MVYFVDAQILQSVQLILAEPDVETAANAEACLLYW